jgi:hypothetical protein
MLSACGGGGGGTVASPDPSSIPTIPFTKWSDVQGTTNVEAKGLGKYANYTYIDGVVTDVNDNVQNSPNPTTSAVFTFVDSTLKAVSINSNGRLAGGPTSDLADANGNPDPDFVKASSADGTSRAVVSDPKSGAWDYQSFGVWENGRNDTSRTMGVFSVGNATGKVIQTSGTATFDGKVVGSYIDKNGNGNIVLADLTVTANFGGTTPSLSLLTSNTRISSDVWSNIAFGAPPVDLTLSGNLAIATDGTFKGTLNTASGLTGESTGQFYGPTAQELGGVFVLPATGTSVETYSGAYGATQTSATP